MKMSLASIRKKMKTFTSSFTSTIKTISSPIYGGSDHLAEAQQLKAKEKQARFRKFPQTNQNTMAAGAAWGSGIQTPTHMPLCKSYPRFRNLKTKS